MASSWFSLGLQTFTIFEPPHDKTDKMACAPREDPDQPGLPPSLIRVFAVRMKKAWVLSYPLSAQRRLWSDWADLSLCWAHNHFVGFVVRRLIWRWNLPQRRRGMFLWNGKNAALIISQSTASCYSCLKNYLYISATAYAASSFYIFITTWQSDRQEEYLWKEICSLYIFQWLD